MHKLTASVIPLLIGLSACIYESDARIVYAAETPADGRDVHMNGSAYEFSPTHVRGGVVTGGISQFERSHPLVPGFLDWMVAGLIGWKATDRDGILEMRDPSPYEITPLPAPVLLVPVESARDVPLAPTLSWIPVNGAESYHVQITEVVFSEPLYEYDSVEGTEVQAGQLSASWTYYWRVRARRNGEYGFWSETRRFTTLRFNSPPYVYNSVNDTTVIVGAEYTIPYIFADDDWTPLTYTARSSDDEIVAVEAMNYAITITAISIGSATITATSTDPQGASATHSFRVTVAAGVNSEHATGDLPNSFALRQNYPNPFNPRTVIAFDLPQRSSVTLKLYDVLGKEVATLASGDFPAGRFQAVWDASSFPSGVYLYQLEAETYSETRRLVLQR